MLRHAWLLGLLLVGCAGAMSKQRADGTYVFDCGDHKRCFDRAAETCGELGYIVVGGKSNKEKYGTPGNEVFIGKDEIYVRCNRDRPSDAPDSDTGDWSLRRKRGPKSQEAPKSKGETSVTKEAPALSAPPQNCRPGETQRCVGPGACDGGQACLADGSAYGPCDCGSTSPEGKAATQPAGGTEGAVVAPR